MCVLCHNVVCVSKKCDVSMAVHYSFLSFFTFKGRDRVVVYRQGGGPNQLWANWVSIIHRAIMGIIGWAFLGKDELGEGRI